MQKSTQKNKYDKKLSKQRMPETKRNFLLVSALTFIMQVIPPLIVALISHFTIASDFFDHIAYLGMAIFFWLTTLWEYPRNQVFHMIAFGMFIMIYVAIAVMVLL